MYIGTRLNNIVDCFVITAPWALILAFDHLIRYILLTGRETNGCHMTSALGGGDNYSVLPSYSVHLKKGKCKQYENEPETYVYHKLIVTLAINTVPSCFVVYYVQQ